MSRSEPGLVTQAWEVPRLEDGARVSAGSPVLEMAHCALCGPRACVWFQRTEPDVWCHDPVTDSARASSTREGHVGALFMNISPVGSGGVPVRN